MKKHQKAASLMELIVSIAIVSISLSAVVMTYFQVSKSPSAYSMSNAIMIANNYLNEILRKDFPTTLPCPTPTYTRVNYTNVCDYNNLIDLGIKDYKGNQLPGLEKYNVYISIDYSNNAILGDLTGSLLASTAKIIRIDLKVTNSSMPDFIISAYKGNY